MPRGVVDVDGIQSPEMQALKNKTTLKFQALKSGLIKEKEYDKIVDPKKMIYPA